MILKKRCNSMRISTMVAMLAAFAQLSFVEPAIAAPDSALLPQVASPAAVSSPSVSPQLSPSQPQSSLSPEELGDQLMASKQYEAAIHAFNKAKLKSADVWNKIGIAYELMFDNQDALRCYMQAIKLEPANSKVLNNIGTVYVSLDDRKSAERYYRKALKIDPKSADVLKNLGTDLLARKKFKDGGKYYAAALAIDPNIFQHSETPTLSNPSSAQERGAMNYYMARGCARAGMTACALDYLRKALDEGFTNPQKVIADSDFASIRGIPEFEQLLNSQRPQ
jgi:tetratricopeptide (TPR) repeat protein